MRYPKKLDDIVTQNSTMWSKAKLVIPIICWGLFQVWWYEWPSSHKNLLSCIERCWKYHAHSKQSIQRATSLTIENRSVLPIVAFVYPCSSNMSQTTYAIGSWKKLIRITLAWDHKWVLGIFSGFAILKMIHIVQVIKFIANTVINHHTIHLAAVPHVASIYKGS